MGSASERRRYYVTSSLIGQAHTQNVIPEHSLRENSPTFCIALPSQFVEMSLCVPKICVEGMD